MNAEPENDISFVLSHSDVDYLREHSTQIDVDVLDQIQSQGNDCLPNATNVPLQNVLTQGTGECMQNVKTAESLLSSPQPQSQPQSHFVENINIVSSPLSSNTQNGLSTALGELKLVTTSVPSHVDVSKPFEIVGSAELPIVNNNINHLPNLQIVDPLNVPTSMMSAVPIHLLTNPTDAGQVTYVLSLEVDDGSAKEGDSKEHSETTPEQPVRVVDSGQTPDQDYDVNNIGEPDRSSMPANQLEKHGKNIMDETIVAGNITATSTPHVAEKKTSQQVKEILHMTKKQSI